MIWIVTDHPETRQLLPPLIAACHYEVATIDCGDEVIKRIRFQTPALLVIDCALPDSFDLISKLRAERKTRMSPVVMFSAASENLRDKALLIGADAYVQKGSLDWAELLDAIHRLAGPPPAPREK